jgi:DNA-binding GntR family transcriptional regulator
MFADRFSTMSLRTEMTIGVEKPPPHISSALRTEPGIPLLVVSRLILTDTNQPVGYGKAVSHRRVRQADRPVRLLQRGGLLKSPD